MIRLLLLLLVCLSLSAQSLLIRNVTIIDGTGAAARPNVSVLIVQGRIRAIGPAVGRGGKGVRTIDGRGKYLIPGLWDMHVHLWESESMFPLYVANGIVGLRDMGSDFARVDRWRKQPLAPRVFTSGAAIDGKPSELAKLPILPVTSTEQASRVVDTLFEQGVDFIKVLSRLTPDEYDAVAYRARIQRIPFAGHIPNSVSAWHAIDERQKSIEHLFGLLLACSTEEGELRSARSSAKTDEDYRKIQQRIYDTYSEARALELFRRCERFGVWQTPTISLLARLLAVNPTDPSKEPNLKYVPASVRKSWKDPAADENKPTDEQKEAAARDFNKQIALVKVMRAAGNGILAGTDTGDDFVLPGFTLHDELKWLVTAGLTPMEALQTATRNPARFFGIESQTGTIERGRSADLVMLDANPLEDIGNTRRIHAVILRGRLLDRKRLDQMLAGSEAVK